MKKLPRIRFTVAGPSLFKEKAFGEAVLPEGVLVGVAGLEPAQPAAGGQRSAAD